MTSCNRGAESPDCHPVSGHSVSLHLGTHLTFPNIQIFLPSSQNKPLPYPFSPSHYKHDPCNPLCDGLWGKDIKCATCTAQCCPTVRLDPTSVRSTLSPYAFWILQAQNSKEGAFLKAAVKAGRTVILITIRDSSLNYIGMISVLVCSSVSL
jgi:hypothetical protein